MRSTSPRGPFCPDLDSAYHICSATHSIMHDLTGVLVFLHCLKLPLTPPSFPENSDETT